MQKLDTGHVYAMKILRKADMLEKEQVRAGGRGALLFVALWAIHTVCGASSIVLCAHTHSMETALPCLE